MPHDSISPVTALDAFVIKQLDLDGNHVIYRLISPDNALERVTALLCSSDSSTSGIALVIISNFSFISLSIFFMSSLTLFSFCSISSISVWKED